MQALKGKQERENAFRPTWIIYLLIYEYLTSTIFYNRKR